MYYTYRSRLCRVAVVASSAMLILGGAGFAQKVQTFDEAPSIEQLRSIMIPESHAGAGRTIVIQRPNTGESPVQPASTQIVASPQASATANQPSPPQTVHAAATPSAVSHAAAPAAEASGAVAFYINFAFNSAVLPDSAHVMIDRIAQLMKEEPQVKLRVEGHTDAAGSADYNISLSEQRALSVAQYLEAHGIAPARLKLIGKGKTEPLTHDPYEAVNRRVQFVRIG